ncbi:MAG TPA: prepilin-type N-terminal cleavage/methylation domain-containing protein [Thermoanaerobaculia bacterium]
MHRFRSGDRRRQQRGMTLIETLVAVSIFTVIFLTALSLYETANRAYLQTDAASVQQQNTRFAMDRMTQTLRDAGASFNPLGKNSLADEQIEGAWESAIFVRGDFDDSRETALETVTFPMVRTGNDEIVGFVLRKPGANTINITIKADLTPATGRDAIFTTDASITGEETATIAVAATTLAQQTNPPYELTRVSFNAAGNPVYEVIADNVFRLSFKYYAETGTTEIITAASNSGSADAQRIHRRAIRRIEPSLTAMTSRPDRTYTDPVTYTPAEGAATKSYRKLTLTQMIVSHNLGMKGKAHYDVPALTLNAPAYITACNGHCRRYLVQWPASTSAGVTTYKINISAAASGSVPAYDESFTVIGLEYEFEEPVADLTAGVFRTWTFKVAPVAAGETGTFTSTVTRASANPAASTPTAPTTVTASQSPDGNALSVNWDHVTLNTAAIADTSCTSAGTVTGLSAPPSPWNQQARDLGNYKVYRVRSTGTNSGADAAGPDIASLSLGELTNTPVAAACASCLDPLSFIDNLAAPCSDYFYRVKACDICDVTSDFSTAMTTAASFAAASGVTPAKPSSAPYATGTVLNDGTNYSFQLTWPPVTRDSAGEKAAVAKYVLERWRKMPADPDFIYEPTADVTVWESTTTGTLTAPSLVSGQLPEYRYYVRGVYDCGVGDGGPRNGPPSDPYTLACTPPSGSTISIGLPASGSTISRPYTTALPLRLVTAGTGWTSGTITVWNSGGAQVHTATIAAAPTSNQYNFSALDVSGLPDGTYRITGSGTIGSCVGIATETTFELETIPCGLTIVDPVLTGAGINLARQMTFRIQNSCPSAITFNTLTPVWSGVLSSVRFINFRQGTAPVFYNNATGVASGATITLSQAVTLTAATSELLPSVSPTLTFEFSDNFTHDGTHNNGIPGKFTSILVGITSPSPSSEQLVDSTPIP